jgi:hypothetical protein
MKTIIYCAFTLLAAVFYITGCATGSGASGSGGDSSRYGTTVIVDDYNIPLESYIGRLSGVQVSGTGSDAVINIRGARSVQMDTRPLLVIDGSPIGKDYSRARNLLRIEDIHSISVITLRRATQLYGSEGNSGAIEIVTHIGRRQ